mgnify:CR=1 FL=1
MHIWIDGDGCPVISQTISLAKAMNIGVTVVKNHAVHLEDTYAQIITVDTSRDAADYYIANHIRPGDVVVTQDYGLGAMVLAKKGLPITQMGKVVTADNIEIMLAMRHQNRLQRMQGKRGSAIPKRTREDDVRFEEALKGLFKGSQSGQI